MKFGPFIAAFGIAAGLCAFTLGSPRPATAAPDNQLGMALLGGMISPSGELQAGSGITDAVKTNTGEYVVTFDRDINGCPHVLSADGGFGARASIVGGSSTTLSVWTRKASDNTAVDDSFSIIVFYPK